MTASRDRRLWLVRHGETEGQSSIRFHGHNDVPLSDEGRGQVRALLPLLSGVAFDRVWCSPLSRARESAELLVDGLGLDRDLLRADERLRELSFGACEGMTRDEITAVYPDFWADYVAGRTDAFPGGESRAEFAARVALAAQEFAADATSSDALVVAHRGIVKHVIGALLGLPMPARQTLGAELASVSVLQCGGHGIWRLEAFSLLP